MYTEESPLLAPPSAAPEQVIAYMLGRPHDNYSDDAIRSVIVPGYFARCLPVGVDPVLALAQLIHETGNLTSFWSARPQRNPAGLGVNGQQQRQPPASRAGWAFNTQRRVWEKGLSFGSWEGESIVAHVGRLLAYAIPIGQATPAQQALIDQALAFRPLPAHIQGSAPTLRPLGRRHNPTGNGWASPGDRYGAAIAAVARQIIATVVPGAPLTPPGPAATPARPAPARSKSARPAPPRPSGLAGLTMLDLRASLPRKSWAIGTRDGPPTSVTLHYNGPPLANRFPEGELAQLVTDARWQMRPGGLGAKDGGDGLQYHFVVLSDGRVAQTREVDALLWHCANAEGNRRSLSVHLPVGGDQDATAAQWEATTRLFETLIAEFGMAGRSRVYGHQEWSDSSCPGPLLMERLRLWREQAQPRPMAQFYRVRYDDTNVRQGPGLGFPVALVTQPGHVFAADALVAGQSIGGEERWLHRADGIGFVHLSVVEAVEASAPVLGAGGAEVPGAGQRYIAMFDQLPIHAEPSALSAVVALLRQGDRCDAVALVQGQPLGANPTWVELADPHGYAHENLLRPIGAA
jgi:hypothetical protein